MHHTPPTAASTPSDPASRELATTWARRLRTLASPACSAIAAPGFAPDRDARAFIEGFRDEAGHHRPIDRPFLAWTLGVRGLSPAKPIDPRRTDLALWWSLADGRSIPALPAEGPLCPAVQAEGIETWTEAELAATHALWTLARERSDEALARRADHAARWLIGELQPDNATNHPWAAHAFVAVMLGPPPDANARHYLETLIHNALVERGRAERFSAFILLESAQTLERWLGLAPPS